MGAERPFGSLAQAVETYYDDLKAFIVRRTGSPSLAADVVQDTWVRAASAEIAMPDNVRAYLYRMAANLAIDHLRRDGARARGLCEETLLEDIPSAEPAVDRVVAARQELAILSRAVAELPEKCRIVFLLYRGRGLTMKQVAARLGISEKAVEKHIARAMVHCRKRMIDAGRSP
ncbi:RNA polymerase sigma factor [Rhodospirillum rubrum]|uniref:Sigma-24 (FecI) n=1 Tax=Rhodospirillum rubrum (strain ATCC 11170 / ATH 1.1.1 / DSM 467 / LMG 4362 / NCIMB 8255 / S1) TaxID=269796 RepID=Q2RUF6_RHORT|nr:RNA polymerase sigma factor [Rhodospirillum rubrum]ABC22239.1 Sigma-24 (FecI) [Rhodospirillum rubrum ATCC 11170]MBK5953805.1 RNA polymerase sigma factor [Rhodospirillum rubrum]HCF18377.1 RNA polymerase sigma factor [Rhodospirillum rubrum]